MLFGEELQLEKIYWEQGVPLQIKAVGKPDAETWNVEGLAWEFIPSKDPSYCNPAHSIRIWKGEGNKSTARHTSLCVSEYEFDAYIDIKIKPTGHIDFFYVGPHENEKREHNENAYKATTGQ